MVLVMVLTKDMRVVRLGVLHEEDNMQRHPCGYAISLHTDMLTTRG